MPLAARAITATRRIRVGIAGCNNPPAMRVTRPARGDFSSELRRTCVPEWRVPGKNVTLPALSAKSQSPLCSLESGVASV